MNEREAYQAAITILANEEVNFRAVVVELMRRAPSAFVDIYGDLNRKEVAIKTEGFDILADFNSELLRLTATLSHLTSRKVAAIKECRDRTRMGLKEAKDYVEALMDGKSPALLDRSQATRLEAWYRSHRPELVVGVTSTIDTLTSGVRLASRDMPSSTAPIGESF